MAFNQTIVALSEVGPNKVDALKGSDPKRETIVGATGNGIRLVFMIDTRRYQVLKSVGSICGPTKLVPEEPRCAIVQDMFACRGSEVSQRFLKPN